MGPLIEITTVPIEIEMKTTHSHLVYSRGTAEVEISRDKGGLNIKSRPIKLNVVDAQLGQELITQFAQETQDAHLGRSLDEFGLGFLPEGGIDLDWEPGQMQIRYEMDKLNFDWKTGGQGFEFVPGDIEFSVTQRPEVIIKYVGGALYVPPSADPNYEPVDVRA